MPVVLFGKMTIGGGDEEERYKKLGLRDSIPRIHQFALACKELASILRLAFSKFPKNLQHVVFHDALFAFRTIPEMQASSAVEAANLLLQAAEAALPKQKRSLAAKEFKHAVVAHKRRWKARQEGEGMSQLPQDVLMHIFSFLDLRSLVSAASVSRSWNAAARDNKLWQLQYFIFFSGSDNPNEIKILQKGQTEKKLPCIEDDWTGVGIDWREAFKRAYGGSFSEKFMISSRGYCMRCRTIMWLNDLDRTNDHLEPSSENHIIMLLPTRKIVEYLMDNSQTYCSDSDSDSEEWSPFGLWASPLCTETS